MLKKIIIFIIFIFLLTPYLVIADTFVAGVKTSITRVDSYNNGNAEGHIRILVSKSVAGCESGYFLKDTNKGIDRTLSTALSAFHSNASVIIAGRSGVSWSGSGSSTYCRIHAISVVK
jgi:hypothetical protein